MAPNTTATVENVPQEDVANIPATGDAAEISGIGMASSAKKKRKKKKKKKKKKKRGTFEPPHQDAAPAPATKQRVSGRSGATRVKKVPHEEQDTSMIDGGGGGGGDEQPRASDETSLPTLVRILGGAEAAATTTTKKDNATLSSSTHPRSVDDEEGKDVHGITVMQTGDGKTGRGRRDTNSRRQQGNKKKIEKEPVNDRGAGRRCWTAFVALLALSEIASYAVLPHLIDREWYCCVVNDDDDYSSTTLVSNRWKTPSWLRRKKHKRVDATSSAAAEAAVGSTTTTRGLVLHDQECQRLQCLPPFQEEPEESTGEKEENEKSSVGKRRGPHRGRTNDDAKQLQSSPTSSSSSLISTVVHRRERRTTKECCNYLSFWRQWIGFAFAMACLFDAFVRAIRGTKSRARKLERARLLKGDGHHQEASSQDDEEEEEEEEEEVKEQRQGGLRYFTKRASYFGGGSTTTQTSNDATTEGNNDGLGGVPLQDRIYVILACLLFLDVHLSLLPSDLGRQALDVMVWIQGMVVTSGDGTTVTFDSWKDTLPSLSSSATHPFLPSHSYGYMRFELYLEWYNNQPGPSAVTLLLQDAKTYVLAFVLRHRKVFFRQLSNPLQLYRRIQYALAIMRGIQFVLPLLSSMTKLKSGVVTLRQRHMHRVEAKKTKKAVKLVFGNTKAHMEKALGGEPSRDGIISANDGSKGGEGGNDDDGGTTRSTNRGVDDQDENDEERERQQQRRREEICRWAAVKIQCAVRRHLAEEDFDTLRKRHELEMLLDRERQQLSIYDGGRSRQRGSGGGLLLRSQPKELTWEERRRIVELQEDLHHAEEISLRRHMVLRPNSKFAVMWKALFVITIVLELLQSALAPALMGRWEKVSQEELLAAMVKHRTESEDRLPWWKALWFRLFRRKLSPVVPDDTTPSSRWEDIRSIAASWFVYEVLFVTNTIRFLDVIVIFFEGTFDPSSGVLVSKPPFQRWIMPGVLMQLMVNPAMGGVLQWMQRMAWNVHTVGPGRCLRWIIALQPYLSYWLIQVREYLVVVIAEKNRFTLQSFRN